MKPAVRTTRATPCRAALTNGLGLATLVVCALLATAADASTLLISDTTLVSGTEAAEFSFQASGPGTVSVQLTNLDWPQALSSLSFIASTPTQVLSSWSMPASTTTGSLTFQVSSGGKYFADVTAAAGGPLDLGAYSFCLYFTPTAPVPLPASGLLLLCGLGVIALMRWRRATADLTASAMPAHPGA